MAVTVTSAWMLVTPPKSPPVALEHLTEDPTGLPDGERVVYPVPVARIDIPIRVPRATAAPVVVQVKVAMNKNVPMLRTGVKMA